MIYQRYIYVRKYFFIYHMKYHQIIKAYHQLWYIRMTIYHEYIRTIHHIWRKYRRKISWYITKRDVMQWYITKVIWYLAIYRRNRSTNEKFFEVTFDFVFFFGEFSSDSSDGCQFRWIDAAKYFSVLRQTSEILPWSLAL